MCGRYVSSSTPQAIAEHFGAVLDASVADTPLQPSWNVAPTNRVYTVVDGGDGTPQVRTMQWGLIPHWAKDTKGAGRMINARAETVAEKPSFRGLLTSRRCLVPMNGFYEWRTDDSGPKPVKQPLFIHPVKGELLAAAGLWTVWRDKAAGPDAPELQSVTIITTGANRLMSSIHDRMPVFLDHDEWGRWLDTSIRDTERLVDLLDPALDDALEMYTVSREVNSVRNKGEHLIDPVEVVDGIGELGTSDDLWSTDGSQS
jgi:putative SOS response-associated peptidase YedK